MLTLRLSTIYIGSSKALPRPTLTQDGLLTNPRRRRGDKGGRVCLACERCRGKCFVGSGVDPLVCDACDGTGRARR